MQVKATLAVKSDWWIARDESGDWWAYEEKPGFHNGDWFRVTGRSSMINTRFLDVSQFPTFNETDSSKTLFQAA